MFNRTDKLSIFKTNFIKNLRLLLPSTTAQAITTIAGISTNRMMFLILESASARPHSLSGNEADSNQPPLRPLSLTRER